jgi:hypothetical protein
LGARHLDEIPVQRQVVADRVLPPFVGRAVVGVVLGNVGIDAGQCELLVDGLRYRLE